MKTTNITIQQILAAAEADKRYIGTPPALTKARERMAQADKLYAAASAIPVGNEHAIAYANTVHLLATAFAACIAIEICCRDYASTAKIGYAYSRAVEASEAPTREIDIARSIKRTARQRKKVIAACEKADPVMKEAIDEMFAIFATLPAAKQKQPVVTIATPTQPANLPLFA